MAALDKSARQAGLETDDYIDQWPVTRLSKSKIRIGLKLDNYIPIIRFSFPYKFLFFEISGLAEAARRKFGSHFDILIHFEIL